MPCECCLNSPGPGVCTHSRCLSEATLPAPRATPGSCLPGHGPHPAGWGEQGRPPSQMNTPASQRPAGMPDSRAATSSGLPDYRAPSHSRQPLGTPSPAPRPRLWPHEASFLVVSGPRVPPWVIAADILFCLGPCPAPSTGDIVRLSLTQAGPDQQDFDLPSTPRGRHDSQPHFYQGQGALGQEPGAKRLLASPKGAQRELDLSPLTLTPRMPRPEEGQERE